MKPLLVKLYSDKEAEINRKLRGRGMKGEIEEGGLVSVAQEAI